MGWVSWVSDMRYFLSDQVTSEYTTFRVIPDGITRNAKERGGVCSKHHCQMGEQGRSEAISPGCTGILGFRLFSKIAYESRQAKTRSRRR